jgi:tight adherence protein C
VLIALLTFVLITAACFAVLMLFVRGGSNRDSDVPAVGGRRPLVFGGLTHALAGIFPAAPQTRDLYSRVLRQAGHYHSQSVAEYLSIRSALTIGMLLLTVAAVVVLTQPGEPAMWQIGFAGLLLTMLMFTLPRIVLEAMAKARVQRVEESLPDAMDMVTMCVSAGLPLQQAIGRVSEELRSSHPDLAYELRIVGRQTEVGSLRSAVQRFAQRMDVPEIQSVASLVSQAEQQGASVSAAFRTFSDQVRLTRRHRAEEAGNKTAFKMLFPIVFCLAPAVYLILLSPAVIELRDFFRREGVYRTALQNPQQQVDYVGADNATGPSNAVNPATPAPQSSRVTP